jgi:hypothetical protein
LPSIKKRDLDEKSSRSNNGYRIHVLRGRILSRGQWGIGYQTRDSFGNIVNSKDSYQTRDDFGNIVNSQDSYQTRDSFGNIVNSRDSYQTRDDFGNIVQSDD